MAGKMWRNAELAAANKGPRMDPRRSLNSAVGTNFSRSVSLDSLVVLGLDGHELLQAWHDIEPHVVPAEGRDDDLLVGLVLGCGTLKSSWKKAKQRLRQPRCPGVLRPRWAPDLGVRP